MMIMPLGQPNRIKLWRMREIMMELRRMTRRRDTSNSRGLWLAMMWSVPLMRNRVVAMIWKHMTVWRIMEHTVGSNGGCVSGMGAAHREQMVKPSWISLSRQSMW